MQITPGDLNKKVPGSDNLEACVINLRKGVTDFLKRGPKEGLPVQGVMVSTPPPNCGRLTISVSVESVQKTLQDCIFSLESSALEFPVRIPNYEAQ